MVGHGNGHLEASRNVGLIGDFRLGESEDAARANA